jgi:hypothetical protein
MFQDSKSKLVDLNMVNDVFIRCGIHEGCSELIG